MKPRRPTSVVALTVLHLVLGAGGLACGACVGGTEAAGSQMYTRLGLRPDPESIDARWEAYQGHYLPAARTALLTMVGAGLVLSLLLVVAGVGLFLMRPWGRTLSLGFAFFAVTYRVCAAGFTFTVLAPAVTRFAGQARADGQLRFEQLLELQQLQFAPVSQGIWHLLGLIYPVAVAVLLTRPSATTAFEQAASARKQAESAAVADEEED